MRYDVVAAAREGASTLLIEKGNSLGGAAGNCLVNPFMVNGTKIDGVFTELSQGVFLEIRDELNRFSDRYQPDRRHTGINTFHEEYLKLILNRMAQNAGVRRLYHAYLTGVHRGGAGIRSVVVMAGCSYVLGRPEDSLCQPMTLCFRLGNIDMEAFIKARSSINPLYRQLQESGKIKNPREDVLIFHTIHPGVLHFNTTRIVKRSPVDIEDLTAAELEAREQVFEIYDFLRENIDGCQNAALLSTAAEIGVRESRMLRGQYLLDQDDLVSCKQFEDSIALGNYDIDIHNPEGSGTSHYYFPEGAYYSIPYRTMLPRETENLLVTGRCISATHEAQASIRIMPIVCCLGEAAGTAAALAAAAKVSPAGIDMKRLHSRLEANGAKF